MWFSSTRPSSRVWKVSLALWIILSALIIHVSLSSWHGVIDQLAKEQVLSPLALSNPIKPLHKFLKCHILLFDGITFVCLFRNLPTKTFELIQTEENKSRKFATHPFTPSNAEAQSRKCSKHFYSYQLSLMSIIKHREQAQTDGV